MSHRTPPEGERKSIASSPGVAVVALVIGASFLACGPAPEMPAERIEQAPYPAVTTGGEESAETPAWLVGLIIARDNVDLAAEVNGRLETIHAQVGDRVRLGDVVATLDATDVAKQLERSAASVRVAEAELRQREIELDEARALVERVDSLSEVVSAEDRAAARADAERAAAGLDAARAHLAEVQAETARLEQGVERSTVRAPFDGTIAARYRDQGSMVRSGEALVRLISSQDLRVRFGVTEQNLNDVKVDAPIRVSIDSLELVLDGAIEHVAPELDTAVGLAIVEGRLDVPEPWRDRVQPGLSARVLLP